MLKKYILALDFDGVILNSARENYHTGLIAYKKFGGRIDKKNLPYKKFLSGRLLCRSGEDFYLIFKLTENFPEINFRKISFKKWKSYLKKHKRSAGAYTETFYQARKELIKNNFKKWLLWQKPYKGIIKELKKAKKIFKEIVVATAKDKNSAETILNYYGLKLEVTGREFSTHKHEQLSFIKEKFKTNYEKIIFIDDFIENLIMPQKLGVNVGLAGWGYARDESLKLAEKENIPVIKLKNLTKQIIGLI